MKNLRLLVVIFLISSTAFSQQKTQVKFSRGEKWWVGIIDQGHLMPLKTNFNFDMASGNTYNQLQPLFISNQGRYIFSEKPVKFKVDSNGMEIKGDQVLTVNHAGTTLKQAYLAASAKYFSFNGKHPDNELFDRPQYNTWIELNYHQNQKGVLHYAQNMLDNGLPPGVIMIDDTWQHDYGYWDFDANSFPSPKAMMDTLHKKGFKVMLWICPFVSPDSRQYRTLAKEGGLLLNKDNNQPEMVNWWNGISAVLDLSHPNGVKWFKEQLNNLQNKYGVDGFKFDAGDPRFYIGGKSYKGVTPEEQCMLFNELGEAYLLNEYRAAWKVGGAPLGQRLADKRHSWEDLQKLIPQIMLQGIMGYPFACPDMIGGGQITSFSNNALIDQDLLLRSAQCHVFMPMMQFSVNPFRILDDKHAQMIKEAVTLRQKFVPIIMDLVKAAAKTGEPVVRMMEYEFPNQGFGDMKDQFMLGRTYLIAPMLEKGAKTRKVKLPKGRWIDASGKRWNGGSEIIIPVTLESIPYFKKVSS